MTKLMYGLVILNWGDVSDPIAASLPMKLCTCLRPTNPGSTWLPVAGCCPTKTPSVIQPSVL